MIKNISITNYAIICFYGMFSLHWIKSYAAIDGTTSPLSLKSGFFKTWGDKLGQRWEKASTLAALEQEIEDYNAELVGNAKSYAESLSHRRLICLPLDERFDPPMGQFHHGHVQNCDGMSIPRALFQAIQATKAEVPWLFCVSRVDGVTNERVQVPENYTATELDEVIGSMLDNRAPPNYIFLPWWMFRALGLQPLDIVDVKLVTTVPPGSLAVFRPHSTKFTTDIANPQSVMETELRHYASLTKGSTVAFDYNGQRYWLDVVDLRCDPTGEKKPYVKVQDCNLATDFVPPKDQSKKKGKKAQDTTNNNGEAQEQN